MDVGAHLRSARERRGLTLEQVASSTKLSLAVLRRIERNEWNYLPGGLLTRGHLRAYAAEVGVDPDQVVQAYTSQLPSEVAEPQPAPAPVIDSGSAVRPLLTAILGLVVTLGAYSWLTEVPKAPIAASPEVARSPVGSEPQIVSPEATDPVPAIDRRGPHLSLEIDATGPCWISARADGRLVVYRLLEAGEAVTVEANDELVLRVGDPGAFRYTLNGVSGRTLGDGREPVTVTITERNVKSFLAGGVPDTIIPS